MGENTAIAWTDHTWNPWQGCHKVSSACDNCYMYRDKKRYGQDPTIIKKSSVQTWNAPLKWHNAAKVFVCSWSDFFIEEMDEERPFAWMMIKRTPHLTYQILTKRPERIKECLPDDWGNGWPNVWIGVTVENQEMADLRIPILLQIPAAVRFVSIEPMLGPVDISKDLYQLQTGKYSMCSSYEKPIDYLNWVICGGETGPNARPMHPGWVWSIQKQCQATETPFFFKQWGEWYPIYGSGRLQGDEEDELAPYTWLSVEGQQHDSGCNSDALMLRVGKKNAGDFISGKQYHEFPEVPA